MTSALHTTPWSFTPWNSSHTIPGYLPSMSGPTWILTYANGLLVGPFPTVSGHTHLLTCVDRFTCWPQAIPLTSTTTDVVATLSLRQPLHFALSWSYKGRYHQTKHAPQIIPRQILSHSSHSQLLYKGCDLSFELVSVALEIPWWLWDCEHSELLLTQGWSIFVCSWS